MSTILELSHRLVHSSNYNPTISSANSVLGWLSVLGWQAAFASICYLCGTLIQGLLVFNYSDPSGWVYGFERWHGTLLTIAIAAVGTVVNTWGYKILPPMEGLILAIHIFGFVVVVVLMWVMSPGQASGDSVWKEFTNSGEWPSMGLACLVGQLTPIFSWTGPDAATHMGKSNAISLLIRDDG